MTAFLYVFKKEKFCRINYYFFMICTLLNFFFFAIPFSTLKEVYLSLIACL